MLGPVPGSSARSNSVCPLASARDVSGRAAALLFFSVFHSSCVVGTWRSYARRDAEVAR